VYQDIPSNPSRRQYGWLSVVAGESILFNYWRTRREENAIDLGYSSCSRDAGICLTDAWQFINRISSAAIDV